MGANTPNSEASRSPHWTGFCGRYTPASASPDIVPVVCEVSRRPVGVPSHTRHDTRPSSRTTGVTAGTSLIMRPASCPNVANPGLDIAPLVRLDDYQDGSDIEGGPVDFETNQGEERRMAEMQQSISQHLDSARDCQPRLRPAPIKEHIWSNPPRQRLLLWFRIRTERDCVSPTVIKNGD